MCGNLLIVSLQGDDIRIAQSVAAEEAMKTSVARTYREAVMAAAKEAFALIFRQEMLPDGNWKDVLSQVAVVPEPPRVVLIADPSERSLWAEAISLGAYDVIAKPVNRHDAQHIISRALAFPSARHEYAPEQLFNVDAAVTPTGTLTASNAPGRKYPTQAASNRQQVAGAFGG